MTKKMKGVALDSSPYGSLYGDAKTMLKHQTLLQEYQELQKDVEASKNKLESMQQRRGTLLAEVRFLRHRHKYLKRKSQSLSQVRVKEHLQPNYVGIQRENIEKVHFPNKKKATLHNLPPIVHNGKQDSLCNTFQTFDTAHKEKHLTGKKNATRYKQSITTNLYPRGRLLYMGKEMAHQTTVPIINLNQQDRIFSNGAALPTPTRNFDLNEKETTFSGKQSSLHSRTPVFDLNQISREEEEFEDIYELGRLEEPNKGLINEDQLSDLKLSVCRNAGDGSSRVGKRKISWQDPVALRV